MTMSIKLRRTTLAVVAATLVVAVGSAQATGEEQVATGVSAVAVHTNADASLPVEQRLREELSVVMMDLIQSGAFGNTAPQQIALNVDAPPQKVSNLGLLVDSKGGAGEGLHVLAVTPGGSAERMGLRAGDVLLALNDTPLAAADGAATLRHLVDALPDGGKLDFSLRRDGRTQSMTGASASMYLPAMHLSIGDGAALASNADSPAQAGSYTSPAAANASQGCGRISVFDVAPRQQQLHAATLIAIDGVTPGPFGAKSYTVGAGSHMLKIGERIESKYISFPQNQRNPSIDGGYKMLRVDVAPDTTYFVAARLNVDQRDNPSHGAYWDPVMWKEVPEACR